jgi:selenide,water dikinase
MGQLAQVLRGLSEVQGTDRRLLVGPETFDDAGVVALAGAEGLPADCRMALVQTVDYFPPVVDDPYFYGAIAAANALSDVYAMGGRPFTALNIAGIPRDFPEDWTAAIFRGGFEKMREAGAIVAGGHTVQSNEALFGFAVTGLVDREKVAANSGARPGDVLYLTKALGMGAMTTGAKQGKIAWKDLEPAARQMATLNDRAAAAMNAVGAHACTDVTGFGLVGHAKNIASASGVTIRFDLDSLPIFPGALELVRQGVVSGASQRGRTAMKDVVSIRKGADEALVKLVFDAETSGGLLIAVSAGDAPALERELSARGLPGHRVGQCAHESAAAIELA